MKEIIYNRTLAIKYAEKWAYDRNPRYYNFDDIGGDCTNFISQCIFAGSQIMNYNKNNGWYYINENKKSPSWTGVEFLYKFLVNNKSVGPFGEKTEINNIQIGDIIQLTFDGNNFTHSLIIVNIDNKDLDNIYTSSHTDDSFSKRVSSYSFKNIRFIHINGIRKY